MSQPSVHTSVHGARSLSRLAQATDRAVGRGLRVQSRPTVPPAAGATTSSRPFETPVLIAGVRCVLRYVVLPFVLPLLGVGTGATLGVVTGAALALLLALDLIAVVALAVTVRRLWQLQHPRRWQYLPLAIALAVLVGFFFANDASVLFI